jgi:hypothetical protein
LQEFGLKGYARTLGPITGLQVWVSLYFHRGTDLMKKLVAMIFFAMLAGNAMAQAGGASAGAGGGAAGGAAGATAGVVATVAVAVAGVAAAGASNSTSH